MSEPTPKDLAREQLARLAALERLKRRLRAALRALVASPPYTAQGDDPTAW